MLPHCAAGLSLVLLITEPASIRSLPSPPSILARHSPTIVSMATVTSECIWARPADLSLSQPLESPAAAVAATILFCAIGWLVSLATSGSAEFKSFRPCICSRPFRLAKSDPT